MVAPFLVFYESIIISKAVALLFMSMTLASLQVYCKESSGISFTGSAADKIVELISMSCDCKHRQEPQEDKPKLNPLIDSACKESRPSDCSDLMGTKSKSGVYKIYPDKTSSFDVYCDMTTDGGGWTVFQRRINGKTDFNRKWELFKNGFGNLKEEFWLGNEHVHQLTSHGNYILRIDLEDFDNKKRYAQYKTFSIGDEKSGYKLAISGYNGDAGDSMAYHNGHIFSTKDHDHNNCVKKFKGAWWHNNCHTSNLNGQYLKGKHDTFADGVDWKDWRGYNYSLKKTSMMIRRA